MKKFHCEEALNGFERDIEAFDAEMAAEDYAAWYESHNAEYNDEGDPRIILVDGVAFKVFAHNERRYSAREDK